MRGQEDVRYLVACTLVSGASSFSLVVVCVWQDVGCSGFLLFLRQWCYEWPEFQYAEFLGQVGGFCVLY